MTLVSTIVSLALAVEPAGPDEELVAVAAPSMSVSPGSPAKADAPPDAAVEEFRRGRILFEAADYRAAKEAFERANELHASPDLQYNIAQCHMRLGEYEAAIPAFEAYLEGKGNPPDAADVKVQIAEAKQRIAEREATLARLRTARIEREKALEQQAPASGSSDAALPDEDARERPLIIGGATLLGLGLAGTAGSVTGLALAIERNNDRIDAINRGNVDGRTYAEALEIQHENQQLATGEYVAIGVGSAVTVAGLVMMSVGLARRNKRRRGVTAWSPTMTRGAYGISLSGAF